MYVETYKCKIIDNYTNLKITLPAKLAREIGSPDELYYIQATKNDICNYYLCETLPPFLNIITYKQYSTKTDQYHSHRRLSIPKLYNSLLDMKGGDICYFELHTQDGLKYIKLKFFKQEPTPETQEQ